MNRTTRRLTEAVMQFKARHPGEIYHLHLSSRLWSEVDKDKLQGFNPSGTPDLAEVMPGEWMDGWWIVVPFYSDQARVILPHGWGSPNMRLHIAPLDLTDAQAEIYESLRDDGWGPVQALEATALLE